MCPFGAIKDAPDSCDFKVGFIIVGSSCAIWLLYKTVLNLSIAGSCAELQSVTHQPTYQPTSHLTN